MVTPQRSVDQPLSDSARTSLRNLILVLADSKRLLGTRYGAWILGAPELETGIACASMAQDEWGHGRLLYALLKDLGDDVDALEHSRAPSEYYSMEVLDAPAESWAELVVLNALVDTALTVQLESLRASSYAPARQRVGKLLDEEHFHGAHGAAWVRRMAHAGGAAREALVNEVSKYLPALLRWFGPSEGSNVALREEHVVDVSADDLRSRFVDRVRPLLQELGLEDRASTTGIDFSGFDDVRRRAGSGQPDDATIAKVRGDKNRAFLMD